MLGYNSKDQLLAANRANVIIPNLRKGLPFSMGSGERLQIEPIELDWMRKDGTILKVRLGGRGAFDENGNFSGYEIIALTSPTNETSRIISAIRRTPIRLLASPTIAGSSRFCRPRSAVPSGPDVNSHFSFWIWMA